MKGKIFIRNSILSTFIFVVAAAVFSGCGTSWFGKANEAIEPQRPQTPPAPVVVDGVRTSYADIVEKTSPAVVQITAIVRSEAARRTSVPFEPQIPPPGDERGGPPPSMGVGSGVIVKEDGTILTNEHVISGASRIQVETVDGTTYDAEVIGSDPPSDLAVLKIEGEKFSYLTLGDSDTVRIGDIVLAIGNPLGIGQTVTSGIISAKSRRTGLGNSFQDFLQTDAPINRGNSGGALVNVKGELIGINSQILSGSGGNIGIGFAIPSNMASDIMKQLVEHGEVRRGMLGVNIQDITPVLAEGLDLEDSKGVIVSGVREESAAEGAGIERGDIITEIDGEVVENGNFLRNKVAGTQPGTEVELKILRGGKEMTVKVKLGKYEGPVNETDSGTRPQNEEGDPQGGKLGITLQPLAGAMPRGVNVPAGTKGLWVSSVDPNGAAAEQGINRLDVISEINGKPVQTLEEARAAINAAGNKPIVLLIWRNGQSFYVPVRPRD